MFHTLAQDNHCEFWCGMHPTCKTLQLYLTGMGWWQDSRKSQNEFVSKAQARRKIDSPDRLRKPYSYRSDKRNSKLKFGLKLLKNDMPVLGLAGCHWREMENCAGTHGWSGHVSPRKPECLRWWYTLDPATTPCSTRNDAVLSRTRHKTTDLKQNKR